MVGIDGKYGYIDKIGKEVVKCIYDAARSFREGLAIVVKDGKWGFIDKTGKEVIPCVYDGAESFHEGLALVIKDDKCGYIDKTGKEVIPCIYDAADWFSEGLAWVEDTEGTKLIDTNGNVVKSVDNNNEISIQILDLLTKQASEGLAFALDISDNTVLPVISWEKKYELVRENGETIELTEQEFNELTKVKKI